jgi:hypothetical protein
MPIPTEPVGSLPRPAKLQAAYADYDAGNINKQDLSREQDAACPDLDQAHGSNRLANRFRWRAADVQLRDLSADRHARRERSC